MCPHCLQRHTRFPPERRASTKSGRPIRTPSGNHTIETTSAAPSKKQPQAMPAQFPALALFIFPPHSGQVTACSFDMRMPFSLVPIGSRMIRLRNEIKAYLHARFFPKSVPGLLAFLTSGGDRVIPLRQAVYRNLASREQGEQLHCPLAGITYPVSPAHSRGIFSSRKSDTPGWALYIRFSSNRVESES